MGAAAVSFVKAFQRMAGIADDGIPGEKTYAALHAMKVGDVNPKDPITERVLKEILHHEAIVQEAYFDSVGKLTWGVGVTSASGHSVERYKDNPQSLERCIEVYVWLLREKYLPAVREAFAGYQLTEWQWAASLSFHWNTGAIKTASWVKSWKDGDTAKAIEEFMNWSKPAEIIPRRRAERDLFFHGKWAGNGLTTVWPVKKPSYSPDWKNGRKVDVSQAVKEALK